MNGTSTTSQPHHPHGDCKNISQITTVVIVPFLASITQFNYMIEYQWF